MPDTPRGSAAGHEHVWRDTGFASVDDCECGATRSGEFITEPCTYYQGCTEPAKSCGYCATHCLCGVAT